MIPGDRQPGSRERLRHLACIAERGPPEEEWYVLQVCFPNATQCPVPLETLSPS